MIYITLQDIVNLLSMMTPVFYFLAIILATWIFLKVFLVIIKRALSFLPPLMLAHIEKALTILIWFIGLSIAIAQLGLRIELLLALLVLGGIAAIIAFRNVLTNIADKYFSDVYVPFKIGDKISINGYTGIVTEINPIVTVLMTEEGKIISIPNSHFVTNVLVNESEAAWSEIIIPIQIDKSLDVAEAEAEILKRVNKLRTKLDERFPPMIRTKKISGNVSELSLIVRIKNPLEKSIITNEVNKRVHEALEYLRSKTKSKT